MNRWPRLERLRIGCVQYLNARPLICGYQGPVVFDHPSALAKQLAAGTLDVALVPTFEALRGEGYVAADGIGIGSDGPVFSVFLAFRGPLSAVRTIALDPASLTSVHLLQVLLAEGHRLRPRCVDARSFVGDTDAQLLIGNQAIEFRHAHAKDFEFLDLGEEWQRQNALPFIYAPWLIRAGVPNPARVAAELRELAEIGLAQIESIVAAERFQTPDFRRRYLTELIRFRLGARERAGIEAFRQQLVRNHFLPAHSQPLSFV